MVATSHAIDDCPSAFRYPRGEGIGVDLWDRAEPLEIGKGRIMREGTTVAILSFGGRMKEALLAAEMLGAQGLSTTVADARFAKPLDEALIARLASEHEVLITVEEGAIGGFGGFVLQHLAMTGRLDAGLKIRTFTAFLMSSSIRTSLKRCTSRRGFRRGILRLRRSRRWGAATVRSCTL